MTVNSRLPGFYKLSPEQRFDEIVEASDASAEALEDLRTGDEALLQLADGMVENVVGVMALPLGVGANFRVNGRTTSSRWPPRSRRSSPPPATSPRSRASTAASSARPTSR